MLTRTGSVRNELSVISLVPFLALSLQIEISNRLRQATEAENHG